jgi:hypothetical protein
MLQGSVPSTEKFKYLEMARYEGLDKATKAATEGVQKIKLQGALVKSSKKRSWEECVESYPRLGDEKQLHKFQCVYLITCYSPVDAFPMVGRDAGPWDFLLTAYIFVISWRTTNQSGDSSAIQH